MCKVGTLSNLEHGDIVRTRNGIFLVVMTNSKTIDGLATFSRISCGCSQYLSSYREDLTNKFDNKDRDIVAVYKYEDLDIQDNLYSMMQVIFTCTNPSDYKNYAVFSTVTPSWVRPEAKRMTVKEIEDILGYPVEIVSEKEVK